MAEGEVETEVSIKRGTTMHGGRRKCKIGGIKEEWGYKKRPGIKGEEDEMGRMMDGGRGRGESRFKKRGYKRRVG